MIARETSELRALYDGVKQAFDTDTPHGRIGVCRCGVYLFYDYDGEPIYVGKIKEGIRARVRRHLTNQRTDAVAMSVLDPFEVAEIEMWPFWDLPKASLNETLSRAEYTVFQLALRKSKFNAVLNEEPIAEAHARSTRLLLSLSRP